MFIISLQSYLFSARSHQSCLLERAAEYAGAQHPVSYSNHLNARTTQRPHQRWNYLLSDQT